MPVYLLLPLTLVLSQLASGLRAGGYTLPGSFSGFFREKQQLALQDDGTFTPEVARPPRKIDSHTTFVYNNYLYTGNPLHPQVGDVRVSFWGSKSSHVSLIGKQIKSYFGQGRTILDAPADARRVRQQGSAWDQRSPQAACNGSGAPGLRRCFIRGCLGLASNSGFWHVLIFIPCAVLVFVFSPHFFFCRGQPPFFSVRRSTFSGRPHDYSC